MSSLLQQRLSELPNAPGVYLMKGHDGEIIYVGKAVNLRSRVRAYFNRTDGRAFVSVLDRFLADVETVTVKNEKEALLLENELIKKHKPRFNVQLRDDKNFLCLRLSFDHTYPRLEMVRRIQKDGARYFGPYASAGSIRETLRVVNKYFQLRTCTDYALETRKRPCLLYQIGRCPAPCVLDIDPLEYRKNVDAVVLFLEGRSEPLLKSLQERMREASSKLAFEEAARLRDQLIALQRSLERQVVAGTEAVDQDVFSFYREADRLVIFALYVRTGRISGGQPFFFSGQEFPDDELLTSFVNLYYDADNYIPKHVLLPFAPGPLDALAELLSEKKGERVTVRVPQRGDKADLMKLALQNAERSFSERKRSKEETVQVLERLQTKLHLRNLPRRIECFDISHFQGKSIVASQVASVDGELDKSNYRRYRLKTVTSNDDFASMHEILRRRFRRGLELRNLPDLIVVDGGKGQLASAHAAMKDTGAEGVDLVGLAKSRDLDVEDRDVESKSSPERVFLVDRKDPVVLSQSSPELFILTRLRDEAHRFAITFQRKVLRRRSLESILEQIPGIGEGRRRTLLKHFGSAKKVRAATLEQLAEVLGPAVASRTHAWLHEQVEGADGVRNASLEDAGAF